jgi:hypothetical protein
MLVGTLVDGRWCIVLDFAAILYKSSQIEKRKMEFCERFPFFSETTPLKY